MKKAVKTIFSVVVALAFLYLCFQYIAIKPVTLPSDALYEYHDDSINGIMEIKDKNIVLYFYLNELHDDGEMIYGQQTTYKYSGIYYNKVIFGLHVYPSLDWKVWNGYAIYNDNDEQRARIELTAKENKSLFIQEDYERAFGKSYYETIITDSSIQFGDQVFTKISEEDSGYARAVIDYFNIWAK